MRRTGLMLNRRQLIASAGLIGAGTLLGTRHAAAAGFPERDITFMIPYPPGGAYDEYVRAIAQPMAKALPSKVSVVPDNVAGAGGARAANILYRAKPDGYTISVLNAVGLLLLKLKGGTIGFNINELTWIGNLARDQYALVVAEKSKIRSIADLQKMSRARPVKFIAPGPQTTSYAATLIGTHLLDIRKEVITGYRGASASLVAVMRGDGDAAILTLPAVSQMVAGKLIRVVATFEKTSSIKGAEDATTLNKPDLAQIIELRPVAGPAHLAPDVTATLSAALIKAMHDPGVTGWAQKAGATLDPLSAEETTRLMHEQSAFIKRWAGLLSQT
ncbi:MAG TPA: tripartite tricarboxylate transporter substrate-binding protein [Stellaceae bacterium]|nr:tripartite tricarboxylate transporter substrate-binding protein [Stellaceae bacterium]